MTLRYPWSHLGIEPTDDQKAIRKAYAVKLRETRPDEDPAGFQALLEARDHALWESRHSLEEADEEIDVGDADDGDGNVLTIRHTQADTTTLQTQPEDELTAIWRALEDVDGARSWNEVRARWQEVLSALDGVPFEYQGFVLHRTLHHLVENMRQASGPIPRLDLITKSELTDFRCGPFGAFVDVLEDFDAHFGFSHNDTLIFEYLAEDDALYLIDALTIALRRFAENAEKIEDKPSSGVCYIPGPYLDAFFADDAPMRGYYHLCFMRDKYQLSFSWIALIFSLPFALYFGLHRLAATLAAIAAAIALLSFSSVNNAGELQFYVALAYIAVSIVVAMQWRRFRIEAAANRIAGLTAKGLDSGEIVRRLKRRGAYDVVLLNLAWLLALFLLFGSTHGIFGS
jgi:hypothetical protein